jgi:MFS family permease
VVTYATQQESAVLPVIGAVRSWQLVFLYVGVPGLLVSLLLLTVREPLRKGLCRKSDGAVPDATASMSEVWAYIRDNRATFVCLNLGIAMVTLNAYGGSSWIPEFFGRRFGWTHAERGIVFGLIVAIGGGLGIVTGGTLADWLSRRGHPDATVRVAWLGTVGWLPFGIAFPLAPNGTWAAVILAPAMFFLSMPFGVAPAAIQRIMPNRMRAQATSVYLFVINLLGMGLGPTAVATLTEDVFRDERAVNYSLLAVGAVSHGIAGILLWLALRHYRASLLYFENWNSQQAP